MKARVKATEEIIEVKEVTKYSSNYAPSTVYEDVTDGVIYKKEFLDFENVTDALFDVKERSLPKDEPDYWEKLKHQYAGMAMQGILSNPDIELDFEGNEACVQAVAQVSIKLATALVNKLKEE